VNTRWNNNLRLQKTPKVCKKQPEALPPDLKTFQHYPLQAFALWSNPFSPMDARVSGNTLMAAEPLANLHFGEIKGVNFNIELDLFYDTLTEQFTITVSLLAGGGLLDQRARTFTDPKAVLPFSLAMITWDHDGTTDYVQVRIMS